MREQARIEAVKAENEENLLDKENVVGVGVGQKNKKGEVDTIVVFVKKKVPKGELSATDSVPEEIEGIKTDVVEVGDIRAMGIKKNKQIEKITIQGAHKTRERPLCGGISCIWSKGTACTLTSIVWRGSKAYILQNAHCGFPHWEGAKKGDPIWQPSPFDGGKEEDKIGRSFEVSEIKFGLIHNRFDSCLVEIDDGVDYKDLFQFEIGAHKAEARDVSVGEEVQKSGRTTGVGKAKVVAVNVTVDVSYGNKTARFENQIFTENAQGHFISGGDSSSLVLNKDKYPVGQIFAGSNTVGVFSPIKPILDHFKIAFSKPTTPPPQDDGYMAVSLLDIIPDSLMPGNKGINPNQINLRKEPKIGNNVIRLLMPGTKIEILGYSGASGGYHWARVKILE